VGKIARHLGAVIQVENDEVHEKQYTSSKQEGQVRWDTKVEAPLF